MTPETGDGTAADAELLAAVDIARQYGDRTLYAVQELARLSAHGAQFAARGRGWFDGDPDDAPRYACEALIIRIGGNVARLSTAFERDHTHVPWRAIKTMRNRLAHYYEATDYDVVWSTVQQDLPQIQAWSDALLGRR